MRRLGIIFGICLGLLAFGAVAGTYALTDGTHASGEPLIQDAGVKFRQGSETYSSLVPWGKFTDDGLKQLLHDATTPNEKAVVQSIIVDLPSDGSKSGEITIKPVETPARPSGHLGLFAIFASPEGWFILLVLYAANLYAAYEVAMFRNRPVPSVCGFAAIPFFGIASPIYFLVMPTVELEVPDAGSSRTPMPTSPTFTAPTTHSKPSPSRSAAPAASAASRQSPPPEETAEPEPPASELPPPIIYQRGEFSFNRRFFETKLAPYFRVVLGDAEKDTVIQIQSSRGDFTGKRISRITPTDLYLQIFKDGATADEMIPFGEIMEVQIRHKDLA